MTNPGSLTMGFSGVDPRHSQTTLTSSIKGATPAFRAYNCVDPAIDPQVYQISAPESCVSITVFDGQSILTLYLTSQSIPRMTSMPERGKTIKDDEKITPWIVISTFGTVHEEVNLEPGVTTESLLASWSRGRSTLKAKDSKMNEWETPESNKTVART